MHVGRLRGRFMRYITYDVQGIFIEEGWEQQEKKNIYPFRYVYVCLMTGELHSEPLTV